MENEIIKLLLVIIFKSRIKQFIEPFVRLQRASEFHHWHLANQYLSHIRTDLNIQQTNVCAFAKKKYRNIYLIAILNNFLKKNTEKKNNSSTASAGYLSYRYQSSANEFTKQHISFFWFDFRQLKTISSTFQDVDFNGSL